MKNGLRNLCYAVWTVLGLMLIAHEIGKPAEAQSPGTNFVGYAMDGGRHFVITSSGDIYKADQIAGVGVGSAEFNGNFWTGSGPTAVTPQTWSQIKGQYAPKSGGGR